MKVFAPFRMLILFAALATIGMGCSTEDDDIGRGTIRFSAVGKLSGLAREGIEFSVYRSQELAEEGTTPEKPAVVSDAEGKASVGDLLAGRTYWYKAENPNENWQVISETEVISEGDNSITVEVI